MHSKSIDIDGVKATVHTQTGRHFYQKRAMIMSLELDSSAGIEWEMWYEFIRAVTQSTEVETPFIWPDYNDRPEALRAAREAWLDLPADVLLAWGDALNKVDMPPQIIDLTPDASEKNAVSQ